MATYHLKIISKRDEGNDTASLWLEVPQDLRGAFSYQPGQFLTVEREHLALDGADRLLGDIAVFGGEFARIGWVATGTKPFSAALP